MRASLILLLLVVGACDPVWRVENATSPSTPTPVEPTCIDAGLQAWGGPARRTPSRIPQQEEWVLGTPPYEVRLTLNASTRQLSLSTGGTGGYADADTVRRYRELRAAVVSKLTATCGPFQPFGPDRCRRAAC